MIVEKNFSPAESSCLDGMNSCSDGRHDLRHVHQVQALDFFSLPFFANFKINVGWVYVCFELAHLWCCAISRQRECGAFSFYLFLGFLLLVRLFWVYHCKSISTSMSVSKAPEGPGKFAE